LLKCDAIGLQECLQWVESGRSVCQLADMRAYLLTSGLIFLAVALAHAARLIVEGIGPLQEPIFGVSSLLALAMAVWAALTLRLSRQ
jgi:hypothetical protein